MRHLYLILLAFILVCQNVLSQTPPYLVRAKCYGGSADEAGIMTNIGPTLTRTPDNFILITGASNSNDGDIPSGNNKGGKDCKSSA